MVNAKNGLSLRAVAREDKNPAKKIIITVITLVALAVVITLIHVWNFDTKYQVEAKIADLTTVYYEDYFYPNIFSGNVNMSDVLGEFKDSGLTPVSLRQLILSNPSVSSSEAKFIRDYCDENSTSVQFFPEPPYEKDSYHAEFTYSCKY